MRLFISLLTITVSLFAIEPLVTPKWLNQHLNDKNLVVVEVGALGRYNEEHIPNAMHTDIAAWRFNNGTFLSVRGVAEIEKEISDLGIDKNSEVVLYAPIDKAKALLKTTYIYWVLNYHGIKSVAILDGGSNNWEKQEFPLTNRISNIAKTDFKATIDKSKIADLKYVSSHIGKLPMLDARPSDKYLGITPTPTVKRDGHIRGAMSYSWNYSINSDFTLKPKEKLKSIFKDGYKLDKSTEIIVYCTGGLETSFNYFVLSGVLGYKNIRLYDASMKEWGNRKDTKMSKYHYEVFH